MEQRRQWHELHHARRHVTMAITEDDNNLVHTRMAPAAGRIPGELNTTPLSSSGLCIATNAATVPP